MAISFGLNSFLEDTIFGLMADMDNEELEAYDESIVTSVIETGPQSMMLEDCDEDDDDKEDDEDDDDWDSIDFDDDEYEDSLLDGIDSPEVFDAYSNDGYRPYF